MANEFIARNGLIAQQSSVVTGSLQVTQGITGSLFGTASYITGSIFTSANRALSASYSLTASFVDPLNQNVIITGSLLVGTGSSLIAPSYGLTPNLSIGMDTGSTGAVLDLRNTSGSSPAGSVLGTIQFSSYTTTGNYIASPAQIRGTTSEQASTGNNGGGNIAFWTANTGNGNFQFERMRINNLGQVLIGLTSSLDLTSKLIVSGSTTIIGSLSVTQGITGSLFGTASYTTGSVFTSANPALSASYALTASYVIGGTTLTTQEEGSTLSSTVTTLNFVGAGVVASGTGDTTTVTIAGGGGTVDDLDYLLVTSFRTLYNY